MEDTLSKLELQYFFAHGFTIPNTAMMTIKQLLYLLARPERHTQEYECKFNTMVGEMMKKDRKINITERKITSMFPPNYVNELLCGWIIHKHYQPVEFYYTRDKNGMPITSNMLQGRIVTINDKFSTFVDTDYTHMVLCKHSHIAYKAHDIYKLVIIMSKILANHLPQVFATIPINYNIHRYEFIYDHLQRLKERILSPNTVNIIADVLLPFCLDHIEDIAKFYANIVCDDIGTDDDLDGDCCPYCFDTIKAGEPIINVRPCGHAIHCECFGKTIYVNCPNCRSEFKVQEYLRELNI